MDVKEKIGHALKVFRVDAGLNQSEMGMPQANYSMIEKGKTEVGVMKFVEICKKIGVSPDKVMAKAIG